MRRFEGPNALPQPVQELEPIRQISEQRLARVQMSVNESRQHRAAFRIDDAPGAAFGCILPDAVQPPIADDDRAAGENIRGAIHGDNRAAFDDDVQPASPMSLFRWRLSSSAKTPPAKALPE